MKYLEWLPNVVMVKKSNEKWHVYVEFTDFNNEYLNDSFHCLKLIGWWI